MAACTKVETPEKKPIQEQPKIITKAIPEQPPITNAEDEILSDDLDEELSELEQLGQ